MAASQVGITHFLLGSATALFLTSDVKDTILIVSDDIAQYHINHCHETILQEICQ